MRPPKGNPRCTAIVTRYWPSFTVLRILAVFQFSFSAASISAAATEVAGSAARAATNASNRAKAPGNILPLVSRVASMEVLFPLVVESASSEVRCQAPQYFALTANRDTRELLPHWIEMRATEADLSKGFHH